MELDYDVIVDKLVQRQLALKERGVGYKGFPSSTPNFSYGHGPGGLFSQAGLSNALFSAMILPQTGVLAELPARPSMDANPLYGLLTGVTPSTGSEPVGVCDDPPYAGLSKLCTHTFVFGRFSRRSRVIDIDRSGVMTNRGEFTDLRLLGGLDHPGAPAPTKQNPLVAEAAKALFELGVSIVRDQAFDVYEGNPANNSAQGGRKFPFGFDILINTGYQDAITKQLCPAADSIVVDFGNKAIDTNGTTLVRTITNIMRRLRHIATQTRLNPVFWKISMPAAMFYEVTAIWPCAYETYRCVAEGDTSRERFINDRRYLNELTNSMRGDMYNRTGQFLWIDGAQVPVVLDDEVRETVLPGESFSANMYFIPYTVLGGTPVTLIEHINYDAPGGAMAAAAELAPIVGTGGFFFTSDGGRFMWHKKPPNNFCVEVLVKTEWRLLLLTPHLAARLDNVKYTPLKHERSWDTNSSFYVNGGRTDYVGFGPSFNPPNDSGVSD